MNRTFADILSAMGVRMSTASESDRLRLDRQSKALLRPVLEHYGFDRYPHTLGELCGLFEYCDRLDVLTGAGLHDAQLLEQWQRVMQGLVAARKTHPHQAAVELYGRGDLASLLSWHREQATLTQLGQTYRFVPGR